MGYHGGSLASFGEPQLMRDAQKRTVERAGARLHELTIEHTPVAQPPPGHAAEWLASRKRLPGTLRASWKLGQVTIVAGRDVMAIDVYTNDRIAPYVEWPTMPHLIVPRNPRGMLRFWDKLGNTIYATIVHHTGTKGSYMLTTALAEVAAFWQTIGAEEIARWAREATLAVH
jgi:hypothetical protein